MGKRDETKVVPTLWKPENASIHVITTSRDNGVPQVAGLLQVAQMSWDVMLYFPPAASISTLILKTKSSVAWQDADDALQQQQIAESQYAASDPDSTDTHADGSYTSENSLVLKPNRQTVTAPQALMSLPPALSPAADVIDIHGIQSKGTSRRLLLHHLQENIFPCLPLETPTRSQLNEILALGVDQPFLLDAALGVSACHLRWLTTSGGKILHRVAEHFHQARALNSLQTALRARLTQQSADALVLTAVFLNLLSLPNVGVADPSYSWVFSTRPDRLNWLSLALGMKPLLCATSPYHQNSILTWMFAASDTSTGLFHRSLPHTWNLSNVPDHWLQLFGIYHPRRISQGSACGFADTLRLLAELRLIQPRPENFLLYCQVVGTLDLSFRDDLKRCNERALWIVGFWLA